MATIGLVTFTRCIDNYGQVLQALATQDYLQKCGHKVVLIRHKVNLSEKSFYIILRLIDILKNILHRDIKKAVHNFSLLDSLEEKRARKDEKIHPRKLNEFRKEHFIFVEDTEKDLKKAGVSVLCSGSDQIWASRDKFYFLRFGRSIRKRIAIAPSTGNRPTLIQKDERISKWLMDYSFITTREKSGIGFCNINGFNHAHKILDPTFLMTSSDYDLIANEKHERSDYLLLYLLNSEISVTYEEIIRFANNNRLKVIYVTGQGKYDENSKIYATMSEWLALIRDAKYVITNSFHGMTLSIVYKKKFLILPLTGKVKKSNERVDAVVKEMSLEDRVYNGDLSKIFNDIDYRKSEIVIQENKAILDTLMQSVNL